jgi:nucleotide-binding universal stress UspA family protein
MRAVSVRQVARHGDHARGDHLEVGAMRKILVAYDGGEPGRRALSMAARLARAFGSRVDVVSVVAEGFGRVDGVAEEPAIVHARELVEARALLREEGVEAGLIEPAGDPATTIERLASEGDYDTIVLGASRAAARGAPWAESVTAHVAANSRATVVVAN